MTVVADFLAALKADLATQSVGLLVVYGRARGEQQINQRNEVRVERAETADSIEPPSIAGGNPRMMFELWSALTITVTGFSSVSGATQLEHEERTATHALAVMQAIHRFSLINHSSYDLRAAGFVADESETPYGARYRITLALPSRGSDIAADEQTALAHAVETVTLLDGVEYPQ